MRQISIDIETYSPVDLLKSGVHRYCQHPDFEVLLFGYAVDGGQALVIDLASGESIPDEIVEAVFDPSVTKNAYNAAFEIACLTEHFGRTVPVEQWRCTSVLGLSLGLPGNLAGVSEVCRLPADKQKMGIGKSLIRYFCCPVKATKANGMRTRNYPHHDRDKWNLFKAYCAGDVVAEMAVCEKLIRWDLPDHEWSLWNLDHRINTRGWMVDRELVTAALEIDATIKARLTEEFVALTGITKATQVARVKSWLLEEHDIVVDSLNKESVKALLKTTDDAAIERALQLRQELSKSSTSKYAAMIRSVCEDDRIRGLFQFCGANRTWRWAGRLVQAHNLPKSDLAHEDLILARALVKARDIELLSLLFGNVPALLSELIRTAFVAKHGHTFVVVDFSAIEARVLAWAAGCEWRMEVFRTHGKIYEASAEQMFKLPPGSVGKKSPYRQKGKVAELACIAEGSLVLTDSGLTPIERITPGTMVWDGEDFVPCDGAIYKGEGNVITYDGLTATEDHVVWVEGESEPIQLGVAAARGARLERTGMGRTPVRLGGSHIAATGLHEGLVRSADANALRAVRGYAMDGYVEPDTREVEGLSGVLSTEADTALARPQSDSHEAALRESDGRRIPELRRARDSVRIQLGSGSRPVDTGKPWPESRSGDRPDKQQRELQAGESSLCDASGPAVQQAQFEVDQGGPRLGDGEKPAGSEYNKASHGGRSEPRGRRGACEESGHGEEEELAQHTRQTRPARLYDLLNCGPNNRFTVSGRLVHNCGFMGGVGALIAMGALKMGLKEDELQPIIDAWREANPEIVAFAKGMEKNAKACLRQKIRTGVPGRYWFRYESGMLFMDLPSGRSLCYVKPKLEKVGEFTNITFDGMDQETKRWGRTDTYSGRLAENWTQAVARDCLAIGLTRMDDAGFDIVGHVHDEVIAEVELASADQQLALAERIFAEPIPWAPGLPLKGDGFVSPFYKKDA